MKHILLTGATGFLGSHLLEALIKHGYKLTILKRSTSDTWRIDQLLGQVSIFDIDQITLENVFDNNDIDVVIHLATYYRKVDLSSSVAEMLNANVVFPATLLEVSIKSGVKGFINTGTFFEYDCSVVPVEEACELNPFNFYAKTKFTFDSLLHTYKGILNVITLRIFSPYGPKDNKKVIPYIIKNALEGNGIELSEGLQKLDFVYCDDVVNAYIRALDYIFENENVNEVFNIGSGFPTSIREIVSVLEEELKTKLKVNWESDSSYDFDIVYADISKSIRMLGWRPRTNLREGLFKTLNYYEALRENSRN